MRAWWRTSLVMGVLVASAWAGCCLFSASGHDGPPHGNFDGARFRNEQPTAAPRFRDLLRWQLHRQRGSWRKWTEAQPGPPPPGRVARGSLRVTFINHATVLIQLDGLNVLTDPIWSERASPISWAGPRRVRPPGIRFEDLPSIDVVLLSHNHYDHLDLPTLRRLAEAHHPRFIVGLGNWALLRRHGIHYVIELGWWEHVDLATQLRVHLVPAQHFSARGLCDRSKVLWGGFVIQGARGAVYFAGDTGYGRHFAKIRERLGPPRLAILPIGAYRPRWFMKHMHMSPEEAVRAHQELGAQTSLGVHFGTFELADDSEDEPPRELERARAAAHVAAEAFWLLGFGEGRDVP